MRFHSKALIAATVVSLAASSCKCTDPAQTPVDPDCPSGTSPAATFSVHAELDAVRPAGSEKQIRVRGTRGTAESLCFAPGAQVSFTVTAQGDRTVDLPVPPLAHGAWEFSLVPLSGGDHPIIPPLTRTLAPASASVLRITSNAAGDLIVGIGAP